MFAFILDHSASKLLLASKLDTVRYNWASNYPFSAGCLWAIALLLAYRRLSLPNILNCLKVLLFCLAGRGAENTASPFVGCAIASRGTIHLLAAS